MCIRDSTNPSRKFIHFHPDRPSDPRLATTSRLDKSEYHAFAPSGLSVLPGPWQCKVCCHAERIDLGG
eukprot:10874565-Alexandrium_andersonii.AAC.1